MIKIVVDTEFYETIHLFKTDAEAFTFLSFVQKKHFEQPYFKFAEAVEKINVLLCKHRYSNADRYQFYRKKKSSIERDEMRYRKDNKLTTDDRTFLKITITHE